MKAKTQLEIIIEDITYNQFLDMNKSKNLITSSLTIDSSRISTILPNKCIIFLAHCKSKTLFIYTHYSIHLLGAGQYYVRRSIRHRTVITKTKVGRHAKYGQISNSLFTCHLSGKPVLRIKSPFSVIYFSARIFGSNPPQSLLSFLLPESSWYARRFNKSSTFPNISWASCNADEETPCACLGFFLVTSLLNDG